MGKMTGRRIRGYLLASSALLALPGIARAEAPDTAAFGHAGAGESMAAGGNAGGGEIAPNIVISDPGTPITDRDPTNITGVGQMVVDQRNGYLGLCTGTLINPRTVILAAHCVNEAPDGTAMNPWGYGKGTGQLPIGFGFQSYTRPDWQNWIRSGYQTSIANAFYNANQIVYNADSLKLGLSQNFVQADVAIATLDTPAKNIPTWTILLSALAAPSKIDDVTGTGYHVTITGYGKNGVGVDGSVNNIDYRRRVAENFIGILGSIDDMNVGLGGGTISRPQNLYQLDFDDPRRGTAAAFSADYNLFKDNALPNEGITAPGDSGGPLILDKTFSQKTVIGVLSGAYRFFGQNWGGYGTTSFYQPLYLFWDYIAANNPYRYTGAVAGDGKWSDPTHWQTLLDPAYQIISGGKLVNGIPTTAGLGTSIDTANKFGQVCDQEPNFDYDMCYDVKTKVFYDHGQPLSGQGAGATTGTAADAKGLGKLGGTSGSDPAVVASGMSGDSAGSATSGDGTGSATSLPTPTLANGLPGATGFVPNNIDPDAATKRSARYFDVTLSAAGTTTLDTSATIDRFTISGANARLLVASTGSLTSLMDFNQTLGYVQVNGTVTTPGDYVMLAGQLSGTGQVNVNTLNNIMGVIAPGGVGSVGTLTVGGNVMLASASGLLIDIAGGTTSDKLAVVANGSSTGIASLGGNVILSPVAGSTIRYGDVYTIVTAAGGVQGTFAGNPAAFSAILSPKLVYTANSVQAQIVAGSYAGVVGATPVQRAYASLLDGDRANSYTALTGLYSYLDLQDAGTIQATLESWAPRTEALVRSLGTVAVENTTRLYRARVASLDPSGSFDGSLAMIGQPLQLAANSATGAAMMGAMPGASLAVSDTSPTMVAPAQLPKGTRGFIAGGYLDGHGRSMQTAIPVATKDSFNGWYVAVGVETQLEEDVSALGFGLSYSKLNGTTGGMPQTASGELVQGTLYGKTVSTGGLALDGMLSAGWFGAKTSRMATMGGSPYTLTSSDNALAVSSEVGVSGQYGKAVKIGPRVAFRASNVGFSKTLESGGPMALALARQAQGSAQGLAGLTIGGGTARVRPYASAYYVHEFLDKPLSTGANFVGGIGPNALFALNGRDKDWAEAAVGITIEGERVSLSLGADTTIWREDVSNQAYRGSISFRF